MSSILKYDRLCWACMFCKNDTWHKLYIQRQGFFGSHCAMYEHGMKELAS